MAIPRCVMKLGAGVALAAALMPAAEAAVVHYSTGWSAPHIHYRSASGGWTAPPGIRMADEGDGWFVADTGPDALAEFLFNDGWGNWDHAPGGWNYAAPSSAGEVWVRDGRVTLAPPGWGRIEEADVGSRALGAPRHVRVYLPAWYDRRFDARYPVLYLQDGQNLFDRNAFWGGWAADAAVETTAQAGTAEPLIVVGIDNSPARLDEYTPVYDRDERAGGGADRYLDFVEGELKPFIDARYRTRADAGSTGIGGSSLGGLLSLYAGLTRPRSFGRVLAMSSSLWWGDRWLTNTVNGWADVPRIRVYLDSGGAQDGAADTFAMRDLLDRKGLDFGSTLWHWYEPGAQHNEASWRARLPRALEMVFPR